VNKLPTLISYLGGSAGDLVTSSLNSIELFFDQRPSVTSDCTIKRNTYHNIDSAVTELQKKSYKYVSTHEFDLFLDSGIDVVSVEITNEQVQNLCILRQMQLQHLKITVDHDSHWYCIVKKLCLADKYTSAATVWFEHARRFWLTQMEHRLSLRNRVSATLDFDQLFEKNFVESLKKSNLEFDHELVQQNHSRWLEKNNHQRWQLQHTLESMTKKLTSMDWSKTSGTVEYCE
jgi:hypothetical protein